MSITPSHQNAFACNLHIAEQFSLLEVFAQLDFSTFLRTLDLQECRYICNNERYNFCDGIILQSMLRVLLPKRIIEIGSGQSSCMILDTNEQFLENKLDCTFIDIDMHAFSTYCLPEDPEKHTVIESPIQNIDISLFKTLQKGDVLFIDSSHICEAGSDVFDIIHRILPIIQDGVYIHFHDIFWNGLYPGNWHHPNWNEQDVVRSICQDASSYSIVFFTSYLAHHYPTLFRNTFPFLDRIAGGSLWLQKKESVKT